MFDAVRNDFEDVFNTLTRGRSEIPILFDLKKCDGDIVSTGSLGVAHKQLAYLFLYNESLRCPSSNFNRKTIMELVKNMVGNR